MIDMPVATPSIIKKYFLSRIHFIIKMFILSSCAPFGLISLNSKYFSSHSFIASYSRKQISQKFMQGLMLSAKKTRLPLVFIGATITIISKPQVIFQRCKSPPMRLTNRPHQSYSDSTYSHHCDNVLTTWPPPVGLLLPSLAIA